MFSINKVGSYTRHFVSGVVLSSLKLASFFFQNEAALENKTGALQLNLRCKNDTRLSHLTAPYRSGRAVLSHPVNRLGLHKKEGGKRQGRGLTLAKGGQATKRQGNSIGHNFELFILIQFFYTVTEEKKEELLIIVRIESKYHLS